MRDGTSRSTPGGLTPNALYPCRPGGPNDYVYVFCSRANPEHWQRLLKVIGREDLSGDERYDTQAARSQRGAEVDEIIAAWTRQHTKEEAMQLFGTAGVPAGAVFDTLELMNDPSFEQRGIVQTIDHPTTGNVKMPSWPVRFDGAPPQVKPSPLLGEHVEGVLGSWLGVQLPRRSPPCVRRGSFEREGDDGVNAEIGGTSQETCLLLTSACSPSRRYADGAPPAELDPSPPSMGRKSSARSALAWPFPLPRHRDAAWCHPA